MHYNWKFFAPLVLGIVLALLPAPAGLDPKGWIYLSIFLAVVLGLILEPFPPAFVGLLGVLVAVVCMLVPDKLGDVPTAASSIKWALSGFGDSVVWLIFSAFMFALGYTKSGLGNRIALILVKFFGKSTLGLGYAVAFSDLVLAPFMSSVTARSGGVIFPVLTNIANVFKRVAPAKADTINRYIFFVALATACVTSSLFLTALAPNILAVSTVQKISNISITWMQWFTVIAPAGFLLFFLTPVIAYVLYSPKEKRTEEVANWAKDELKKLGSMKLNEWLMLSFVILTLLGWLFAGPYLNATAVALIAVALMLLTRVIDWRDFVANEGAWNVLIWFATLVALSAGLGSTGVLAWIGGLLEQNLQGISVNAVILGSIGFFFLVHYLFASLTAHTTAMLPVMLTVGQSFPEIPALPYILLLVTSLGLMGIITPYGTGHSPIYYGSGYIKPKDFWWLGAVFGAIYLAAHLFISYPWALYQLQ